MKHINTGDCDLEYHEMSLEDIKKKLPWCPYGYMDFIDIAMHESKVVRFFNLLQYECKESGTCLDSDLGQKRK